MPKAKINSDILQSTTLLPSKFNKKKFAITYTIPSSPYALEIQNLGKNQCFGHVECDGIILDNARIVSTPMIDAVDSNASLVHEAAIGKIAGDELIKLMTLGLSQSEAENMIIQGFLLG